MGNNSSAQYANTPRGPSYDPSQWQVKQQLSNYQVLHNPKLDLNADCYEIALKQAGKNLLRYETRRPGNPDTRDLVWVYHVAFQKNGFLCSHGQTLRVLTQHIPIRLDSVRNLEQSEALGVLKGVFSGFSVLTQEYEDLRLTERCIGFNESGKVKVWLNQNFAFNSPSIEPFSYENLNHQLWNRTEKIKHNVISILKIVADRTFNFNPHLKRTFEQTQPTYEEAIAVIDQYAEVQRIRISPVIRHKHFIESHFHNQRKEYLHKDKQKQGSFGNPTQKWTPINALNNTNNGVFVNKFNYISQQNYQCNHNEAMRRIGSAGSLHSNAIIFRNQAYPVKDFSTHLGMTGSIKLNSPGHIYRQPISTHQLSQRSLTTNSFHTSPILPQMNSQRQNQKKEHQKDPPIKKMDPYRKNDTVGGPVAGKLESFNLGNSLENFRAGQITKLTVINHNLQPLGNDNQQANQSIIPQNSVSRMEIDKNNNDKRKQRKIDAQSHDNIRKINELHLIKANDAIVQKNNFSSPIVGKKNNSSHHGTSIPQIQYQPTTKITGQEDGTEHWKQYQRRKQQIWQSSNKPNQQIQSEFRSVQSPSLNTPKTPQRINSDNTTEQIEKYIRKKYLQGRGNPQDQRQRLEKNYNSVPKQGNMVVNIDKKKIIKGIEDPQIGRHDLMTFMPQDKEELDLQMIKNDLDKNFSNKPIHTQQKNNTHNRHKVQTDILDIATLDKKLTQFSSSRVKDTPDNPNFNPNLNLNSDLNPNPNPNLNPNLNLNPNSNPKPHTKTQLNRQQASKSSHVASLAHQSENAKIKDRQINSKYKEEQTKKHTSKYISNIDQKYQKYIASKQSQKNLFNQGKRKQIIKVGLTREGYFRDIRLKTIQPDSKQEIIKPIHTRKERDYSKEVKASPTYEDMRKLLWE